MVTQFPSDSERLWQNFFKRQSLDPAQQEQFKTYYELLLRMNDIHNLTAITELHAVITDHFEDSLALRKFVDCSQLSMLADVGTGAGFPALPLKILFPKLPIVLIEVTQKKIAFLEIVIEQLGLTDITIVEEDWRTFLRHSNYPIDLFTARASLPPEELIRIFRGSSPYQNAQMIYWASQHWVPSTQVGSYITRTETYGVGDKKRHLVFLKAS